MTLIPKRKRLVIRANTYVLECGCELRRDPQEMITLCFHHKYGSWSGFKIPAHSYYDTEAIVDLAQSIRTYMRYNPKMKCHLIRGRFTDRYGRMWKLPAFLDHVLVPLKKRPTAPAPTKEQTREGQD